jgi:hypothetical protein
MGTADSSPGVKRPGREADYSLPSTAEIKNGGAVPPLSHASSWLDAYLIKHKDNFAFFYLQCLLKEFSIGLNSWLDELKNIFRPLI